MIKNDRPYIKRLIDKDIEKYLEIFSVVNIKGPKWCGKTWTGLNHSNSVFMMGNENTKLAEIDMSIALNGATPRLIDEWQELPNIWDAVRRKTDESSKKGLYILTGSTTPNREKILHSGMGRICDVEMHTMSLYEMGKSDGKISLEDLFNNNFETTETKKTNLDEIIDFVIRGGWPDAIGKSTSATKILTEKYIQNFLDYEISFDGVKRNKEKMKKLLKSLARNESTIVSNNTLINDMKESDDDNTIRAETLSNYLEVLEKLYMIELQPAYSPNRRSLLHVGKKPKRHLSDVSLAVAALKWSETTLKNDLNALGFLFESLCEHDLRIYAKSLDGELFHYHDGRNNEIDAIVELPDGKWGAFEIKLGSNKDDEGAKSLLKTSKIIIENGGEPPAFLCVLYGVGEYAYRRKDGVYVVPITSLKP